MARRGRKLSTSNSPATMKVFQISKKLIKPHTPTPPNLKNYSLSFIDRCIGPATFAVILFYESKPENITQLEESLAQILVQFYPLAGRYIMNDHFVDCSDQGAVFVEAEALDVELIDLVAKPEAEQLNDLLPNQYSRADAPNPLLSIQATHFPSGGVAIAIAVSHSVFDGASLGTFISAWSNATNPDRKTILGFTHAPSFDLPLLLPYKGHGLGFNANPKAENIVVKRFSFDKAAITSLRSKLRPISNGKTLSRVRVVCAVIAKTLIGVDRAKHGRTRDFVVSQAVNLRERTIPPQPKHACGNLAVPSLTPRVAASEAQKLRMQDLVDLIGDSVRKTIGDHEELLSPHRDGRDIILDSYQNLIKELGRPDTNTILFSDWSKFEFYEADFGWGKPVWTSIGPQRQLVSTTVLMTNKDGEGIEAWVHLDQNDMRYFEQDEEIKFLTT